MKRIPATGRALSGCGDTCPPAKTQRQAESGSWRSDRRALDPGPTAALGLLLAG